jgi:hypothetical protein
MELAPPNRIDHDVHFMIDAILRGRDLPRGG